MRDRIELYQNGVFFAGRQAEVESKKGTVAQWTLCATRGMSAGILLKGSFCRGLSAAGAEKGGRGALGQMSGDRVEPLSNLMDLLARRRGVAFETRHGASASYSAVHHFLW